LKPRILIVGALLTATVAACGAAKPAAATHSSGPVPTASLPLAAAPYVGVIGAGIPGSYAPVARFAAATEAHVVLAGYYSGWFEDFQSKFATAAWKAGTKTIVNMDPTGLAGIIAGDNDGYLRRFAAQVKAFGHPVVVSFGHEANGDWFGSYGYKHVTPAKFIAAYREVHNVITAAGARNIIWLWTVNVPVPSQTESATAVWPGAAYVNWVGVDGYDWTGKEAFTHLFGSTATAVRKITSKPVLIAETSVVPGPNAAAQVTGLFAGVKADHLLGFVWYDTDKVGYKGTSDTHDWKLENDPAGLAAFRAAVK
jgi:hypothetical protein